MGRLRQMAGAAVGPYVVTCNFHAAEQEGLQKHVMLHLRPLPICLQWVAEVAVELAGGPATPMLPGREDCGCFDNANIIADECAPATDLVSFWSEPRFISLPTMSASCPCTYRHSLVYWPLHCPSPLKSTQTVS